MSTENEESKEERSALPATINEENARLKDENMALRKELASVQARYKSLTETYDTQMGRANETIAKLQEHIKRIEGKVE